MNQTEQNVKKIYLHSARPIAACRLEALAILSLLIFSLALWSCADPRNEPSTAPDPGYTQTIVLAENSVSNGQPVTMNFEVEDQIAPIVRPGLDQPARLFVTASILPDADIEWREAIIADSIPVWSDLMVAYQVAIVTAESNIEDFTILADSCESNPEDCSPDSLAALQAAIAEAETSLVTNQNSLAFAIADTARLGLARDSLAVVLDDRYRLSIQFDDYAFVAFPNAVFIENSMELDSLVLDSLGLGSLLLAGQEIHLASSQDTTRLRDHLGHVLADTISVKGKTFVLDLAQISAADSSNINRPIELNWTTCSSAERPCLSVGSHSFVISVTGAETWVSAVLVLVYEEER
jgi:hypothetical protein